MSKHIKHKRAFLTWFAIYPLITFLFVVLGEYLVRAPLALRTLILTLIAVPLLSYVILPFYYRLFDRWLNNS